MYVCAFCSSGSLFLSLPISICILMRYSIIRTHNRSHIVVRSAKKSLL